MSLVGTTLRLCRKLQPKAPGCGVTDRRRERDRARREKKRAREAAERRLDELREAWRRRREDGEESRKGPSERKRRA
jgi:hypothetical protein